MALFLGGGGDWPRSAPVDRAFASAVTGHAVVYLPTALEGTALFDGAEYWFAETYGPLGITQVETWHDLRGRSLLQLSRLGGVYIGGGNTYLLLRELRRFGLDRELLVLIERGVHVYGGSAGAIVLGRDITTSELGGDERVPGLDDSAGLDVLSGWSVSCHYTPEHEQFLESWASSDAHPAVLQLPEESGVVRDGARLTVLGPSTVGARRRVGVSWLSSGEVEWPAADQP